MKKVSVKRITKYLAAMKTTLISFCFVLLSLNVIAQVPKGFNYQAIARDGSGNPIINATMDVKVSILTDTTGFYLGNGTYVWEELFTGVKTNAFGLFGLVVGTGVKQTESAASFATIDWTVPLLYIGIKVKYPGWKNMGAAKLWSVPFSMASDTANAFSLGSKLAVVSSNDAATDPLFIVRRKDGQTVFAVYPDAVNVYVPNGSKGGKGGFAIGGFDTKGTSQDFFRVTPDSIRAYIDNTPAVKGSKGGFAIGGFESGKGGILSNFYMNITGANAVSTVDSAAQVLWYPNKQAFLAGKVHIGSVDSVGTNSTALGYKSIAMGNYSQAFGYKTKALGDFSTAIGKQSVAGSRSAPIANNAFALGNTSKATGDDSYAFGSGALASGLKSFAFGSVGLDDSGNPTSTPTQAIAPYTVAIGMGAQAKQRGALLL